MPTPLALAADHGGFALKQELIPFLRGLGHAPLDLGTHSDARCDSQDFAVAMAEALQDGRAARGILICKSGNGIAMAANRFHHVRCALVFNTSMARLSREHNDANVLAFGASMVGADLVRECVEVFLKTEFLGGRYAERVHRLTELKAKAC